jgi:hypothetical protein
MAKVNMRRKVASNPTHTAAQKGKVKNVATTATKKNKKKGNPKSTAKNPAKKNSAKKNPAKKNGHAHSPKRNPTFIGDPKQAAINIVTALLAAVATRQIPQWALGAKNVDWTGYAVNFATALASGFAASEFIGPGAGQAAFIGGGVILLDRVLTEKLSPVGQYLSLTGLGDPTAATSLGTVSEGYYIHPTIFRADGTPVVPHAITDAAIAAFNNMQPRQLSAASSMPQQIQGSPGRYTRFGSRF